MKTTNVFSKNIEAYNNKYLLIINQGGSSSSKTYSILQLLYLIAKASKTKKIISVISYTFPHLKLGAIRDFENILIEEKVIIEDIRNKTELTYQVGNSIIEFFSADNLSKVHGPRRDILFINECNHLPYDVYTQLQIRTKGCVFLDFNPVHEFWVHTDVIPKEIHTFIKSTYIDNDYLDDSIKAKIESRKHNENWWRVYGLGEVGMLEGAIFQNWEIGEFNETLPFVYGLDFGVKDPDALIKVAYHKKTNTIYLNEEIYQNELSSESLLNLINTKIERNSLIIADSANPRTIKDFKNKRINIHPAKKGKIVDEIKILSDFRLVITKTSYNLIKELGAYIWLDKKGEVPTDEYNHTIDAFRYAAIYLVATKKIIH